ncbi:uncharacterized protein N7496_007109 [Penicillium cataractarum]|uniref:Box C/D snoRNA protein 1 n=1 Tax=Penicillium cataractarum TaxID=2100454 RepID=A0A9W9S2U2_9EURO|nr:uncharacterized protein N7496_007109 [Penicillium cataractarum]KAJ5371017.1 hypothetical protein N7496_007109 [Penicillium cataractarum]
MDPSDPLLSELCSICHVNPPKYRCPRCSTRTCSLPCTRRHKLWSQCSGVRDPAAYLKRSELASEAAFDRDFNFITGIERSLERAERDVENRGIELARGQAVPGEEGTDDASAGAASGAGRKRKYPTQGLVKGEAGFLRGAEAGRVKVLRAPRGMSRNKQNTSRWHPKHKCLSWTVEWISAAGEKTIRNALETYPISEAYDRAFPVPREDRPSTDKKEKEVSQENTATEQASTTTEKPDGSMPTATTTPAEPKDPETNPETTETPTAQAEGTEQDLPLTPHRNLYFYLHRPRTTTKKPVLAPLPPSAKLAAVLRDRTVLEFPTVYALPDSPEKMLASKETSPFILEEEYLRTATPEEVGDKSTDGEQEGTMGEGGVDLKDVDEEKVMEVLKQDLFESV